MWGLDSICSAARKIDRTVREDAPAKLKQYTPDPIQHVVRYCAGSLSESYPAEKLSNIPKIMQDNWNSVCFVARKIDKTVRENGPSQRFLINAGKYYVEEIIMGSSLPGVYRIAVRPLYRAGKESLRNRSSVASQLDSQDKENGERILTDERESAKSEASILHLQLVAETKRLRTQAIMKHTAPTNQPFSPEAVIKELNQSQVCKDCSDDVERG